MKTVPAALQTHLDSECTTIASLWKVTRRDGTVLSFTDHDQDIAIDIDGLGTLTYKAATGYNRAALRQTADLRVDQIDLLGLLDADEITVDDINAGKYDMAEYKVALVNWAAPGDGVVKMLRGHLGDLTTERDSYTSQLRGLTDLYNQEIVEFYTPDCRADLGDARCTVDTAPFTHSLSVDTVIDQANLTVVEDISALVANPVGGSPYFLGGRLTWTAGLNAGEAVEIKTANEVSGQFTLFLPAYYLVQPGDTFDAVAGCDKLRETCTEKFDNIINFRGEPFLPGINEALRTPSQSSSGEFSPATGFGA